MDKGMRYLSHYILDIIPYLKVYTKAYPMDTLCIPNREPHPIVILNLFQDLMRL